MASGPPLTSLTGTSPDVVICCHFFVLPLKGPGTDNKYIKILSNLQTNYIYIITFLFYMLIYVSLCVILYIINIYINFCPPSSPFSAFAPHESRPSQIAGVLLHVARDPTHGPHERLGDWIGNQIGSVGHGAAEQQRKHCVTIVYY